MCREFFFLLSHEMFNPFYCLFEYSAMLITFTRSILFLLSPSGIPDSAIHMLVQLSDHVFS
ncbi:hypothetical protein VP01_2175g1 [Puccinia sorghi]|uniref:HECT domain-containing protein n=1 Tax=Puccinia sorghi TaxID=27349 RepID=A0A0L6VA09_9BASI|nr:hypothetical protein VP01_2175g1 [Puccinia sorghi]